MTGASDCILETAIAHRSGQRHAAAILRDPITGEVLRFATERVGSMPTKIAARRAIEIGLVLARESDAANVVACTSEWGVAGPLARRSKTTDLELQGANQRVWSAGDQFASFHVVYVKISKLAEVADLAGLASDGAAEQWRPGAVVANRAEPVPTVSAPKPDLDRSDPDEAAARALTGVNVRHAAWVGLTPKALLRQGTWRYNRTDLDAFNSDQGYRAYQTGQLFRGQSVTAESMSEALRHVDAATRAGLAEVWGGGNDAFIAASCAHDAEMFHSGLGLLLGAASGTAAA